MSKKPYRTLGVSTPAPTVLVVTLNRPAVLNALNTEMGEELYQVFEELTYNANLIRAVVITGSGKRAFCAGGDLKQRHTMDVRAWELQHQVFERALVSIVNYTHPVIAAVNGLAYGGGLEIALCCDFIYAAEGASYALPEAKLGIMPGGLGTQTLTRAVGERRAKELMFTSRPFTAAEGAQWGLFNAIYPSDEVLPAALRTAGTIATRAPCSVEQIKKASHYGASMDLQSGYRLELEAYAKLIRTEDRIEGVNAFNEHRDPQFSGY